MDPVPRSRAALELRRAALSECPSCGRETKTVEGVCAECWEPKQPGARVLRPERKPTPLFDVDVDPFWIYMAVAAAATLAVGVLVKIAVSLLTSW